LDEEFEDIDVGPPI